LTDLYKGDCLEIMKSIADGSIDAIITDPPYGTTACKWDSVIDFDFMWLELNRIIKPNGAIVLFGSEPFSSALRMSNINNYKYDWVWEKGRASGFQHSKNKPMKAHENILVFSNGVTVHASQSKRRMPYFPQMEKGNPYSKKIKTINTGKINHAPSQENLDFIGTTIKNKGERYPRSVIKFNIHNVGLSHPTQKPVALMEYLIKTYTNENETVLDFTMGSGSTGVAAKNTNRNFIGIEQDANYFNIAKERIEKENFKLF
jgi:DNA modification methylase